jgi:hypothetical protein
MREAALALPSPRPCSIGEVSYIKPGSWLEPMVDQLTQLRIVRGRVSSAVGHEQALGLLSGMVREQARVIAYLDFFWLVWVMILATIPMVFFMKGSAAKGELPAHGRMLHVRRAPISHPGADGRAIAGPFARLTHLHSFA